MANQEHSTALWSEAAASGLVLTALPLFIVYDGADVAFSLLGPEQLAFFNLDGTGDYTLLDLTPLFLVFDGPDLTVDAVGPAAAILVDDGAGNLEVSTNLLLTPAADIYEDGEGNRYVVARSIDRLDAMQVGDHIQLY